MQHKAMHDIFRKGQRNDTTAKSTALELILSCEIASKTMPAGRYQHFANNGFAPGVFRNHQAIRQIGRDPPHPHGNFRCRTLLCDVKEGAP